MTRGETIGVLAGVDCHFINGSIRILTWEEAMQEFVSHGADTVALLHVFSSPLSHSVSFFGILA